MLPKGNERHSNLEPKARAIERLWSPSPSSILRLLIRPNKGEENNRQNYCPSTDYSWKHRY